MPAYMDEWTAGGSGQFRQRPAQRDTVGLRGGAEREQARGGEISHPAIEGKDLVYSYKLIEGTMPKTGGATALFSSCRGLRKA
jgi:hypothetical protein